MEVESDSVAIRITPRRATESRPRGQGRAGATRGVGEQLIAAEWFDRSLAPGSEHSEDRLVAVRMVESFPGYDRERDGFADFQELAAELVR